MTKHKILGSVRAQQQLNLFNIYTQMLLWLSYEHRWLENQGQITLKLDMFIASIVHI